MNTVQIASTMKAFMEILTIGQETDTLKAAIDQLHFRIDRIGFTDDCELMMIPSNDLPIRKEHEQYLWDFGYFNSPNNGDDLGQRGLVGGVMFSTRDNAWSSHT